MNTSPTPVQAAGSRDADIVRTRTGNLFSSMVGEPVAGIKSGCRLANHIEEDLIRQGWPVGLIYGSEAELSERFHVGRAVVREAARVLEVRGCTHMRRGPNGGLQVLRPGRSQSVQMVADNVQLLITDAAQIDAARELLNRVRSQINGAGKQRGLDASELRLINSIVLPFFEELVEAVGRVHRSSGAAPAENQVRSRAGQIARRLMTEYTSAQWVRGVRLGSTFDLCERYQIDRDVLRQAVRILESAGMAASLSGRGHGIVSQAPRPASMCRLISCHFAAHGLIASAAMETFHWLSVEAAAKAAERATASDMARIENALCVLENASEDDVGAALFEAEESQFSILENPLIDLFLRSTKAFPAWDLARIHNAHINRIYLEETRKVAAAIARHDSDGAARAQDLKYCRIAAIANPVPRSAPKRMVS